MSETPDDQLETPVAAPPAPPRPVVVEYQPYGFLHQHGLALLALAFAVAGCVLGGVADSRSAHHNRPWHGCPPVILGAAPSAPSYYGQFFCPQGHLMQPGTSSVVPRIRPNIKPFLNPGGPMIPAPQTTPTQP